MMTLDKCRNTNEIHMLDLSDLNIFKIYLYIRLVASTITSSVITIMLKYLVLLLNNLSLSHNSDVNNYKYILPYPCRLLNEIYLSGRCCMYYSFIILPECR